MKGQEWKWGTIADNFRVHVMDEDGWVWNGGDDTRRDRQI